MDTRGEWPYILSLGITNGSSILHRIDIRSCKRFLIGHTSEGEMRKHKFRPLRTRIGESNGAWNFDDIMCVSTWTDW